jgi:hypothetical protein
MPEGIGYGGINAGANAKAAAQKSAADAQAQRAQEQAQPRNEPRRQAPGVDVQISQRAQEGGDSGTQQSDTYADPRDRSRR